MKKVILELLCAILMLSAVSGCGKVEESEISKYKEPVTYVEDNNFNIVGSTTPDEKGIIKSIPNRPFYLVVVDNNEIVDAVFLASDYEVQKNNQKYYKISMLEFYINCDSSLNYNGKENKYNINLLMSVSDPVKFFESSNILSIDTSNNLFNGFTTKDLFNNSLKKELENNLNEIIIEYLEKNNLEFNTSMDLGNYITYELDELVRHTKGIEIVATNLNLK